MRTDQLTTVTNSVPKMINPTAHAVLDYLSAGTFLAIGFGLLKKNRRAAGFAFANGMAVLGLSLLTDYPGGVFGRINFRTHGAIDMLQAATTAAGPALLGFASQPEAQLFYGQAAAEAAIISATDWGGADGRFVTEG